MTEPKSPDAAAQAFEAAADKVEAKSSKKQPPPVDFTTFVLSMGSSALIHLGAAPHPDGGGVDINLPMARQTIDLLAMLRDKTQGNLSAEESRYLEALLHDLRVRFVEATKTHC